MVVPNVENGIDLVPYSYPPQSAPDQTQFTQATKVTKKVLFLDEPQAQGKAFADKCNDLRTVLHEEFNWEVTLEQGKSTHDAQDELTEDDLDDYDILVVPPLFKPSSSISIETIVDFLNLGSDKALLIIANANSIHIDVGSRGTVELIENFGLGANYLVGYRHSAVSTLLPHYITSGIRHISTIHQPVCFKQFDLSTEQIAFLPESDKPFLVASDTGVGRVVVIGDALLFSDKNIQKDDNLCLIKNIFCWLAYKNFVDFGKVEVTQEAPYNRSSNFSLEILNTSSSTRLENIQCQLESDNSVLIDKSLIELPPISYGGSERISWTFNPNQLGQHRLNLTVLLPEALGTKVLPFDSIATFQCVPDAEISLVIHNKQRTPCEQVEIDQIFDVEAITRWTSANSAILLKFSLDCSSSSVLIEKLANSLWRLKVTDIGNYTINLTVEETGQQFSRLLHVIPSSKFKIEQIERNVISRLEVQVYQHISAIWKNFDIDEIAEIPFRLVSPEDFISLIYPSQIQERLFDILRLLTKKDGKFLPLLDSLLHHVAPLYSPVHGCCIPYAPDLANDLVKKYPYREESLAYNFLTIAGSQLYGQTWMEGNIVALLLHEKYGHGFFYSYTKLGQQLAILYRYGLLRSSDVEQLSSPYLRAIHKKYKRVIGILRDSSLIFNEGFATWIELTCLQHMAGCYSETAHRRRNFLFQDVRSNQLDRESPYFKKFHPGFGSKYQIAHDYLKNLQNSAADNSGLQFALNVAIEAAEVDFGITEQDGRVVFALSPDELEEVLLDDNKGNEGGADMRLKRLYRKHRG
ncbi:MAG: hypothetical protein AAF572_10855 [Cyanobacteria bacterium P01_B01_bin.77]